MRLSAFAVCLIVLGLGSPAAAQGLQFGAKGGINVATQSFDSDTGDVSFDPLIGLVAGGFVIWPIGGRFDVEVEGLYSVRGVSIDAGVASTKIKVDYIDAPVLARYRIAGSSTTRRIHIVGGPVFGFRVRAQSIADFGNGSFHRDIKDDLKPFDFGVAAGGDVEFGRFIIDGRYTFGLTNINKDLDDDGVKVTNRAFTFLGGVRF